MYSRLRFSFPLLIFVCTLIACTTEHAFFVSPQGQDSNDGTYEQPFGSLDKARQAVRELRQQQQVPVTVYLRAGVYQLNQSFQLTAQDSGSIDAPVVYRAYEEEDVRLVGGPVIRDFEILSDEKAKSRIPSEFHSQIYQTDLRAQGVSNFGEMKATGFNREIQPAALELFFNGEPMTLARYPNQGEWMHIASVPQQGDSLVDEGSDRVARFDIPIGRHYGRFAYQEDRPARWQPAEDIWLHGYWTHDWADSYVKVDSIDTAAREFVLSEPHGVYGYTRDQKYYALNILEELDRPGEYYLDRSTGVLYFWPPTPPEEGIAYVSILEEPVILLEEVSHVRLQGLTLEGARGEGVRIEGGTNVQVVDCSVRNLGSQGITVNEGFSHLLQDCSIYNVGDGGIQVTGGDRATLSPAGHSVVNNHIHHYSRINKTYRAAIRLFGVGIRVVHNHIHDAPHTGVLFSGNEHLLEYNEVHDIALETGDVGAFYIGRDWTQRGNVVRYNYFHHLSGPGLHGVMAVYLDDAASGTHIYGNLFHQSGRSAFIGGGHDNVVENNIFIECAPAVHLDARGIGWAQRYIIPGGSWNMYDKLEAVNHDQPPYRDRYPGLARLLEEEDPAVPTGNVIRSNISYGGQWLNLTDEVDPARVTIEDNYVLDSLPSNVDIQSGEVYPADSILDAIGFEKIPWDSIGLISN